MTHEDYVFPCLDDVVQGLQLTDGHGLILDEVKVDHIAEESVDADKTESLAALAHHIDYFQCLLRVSSGIDLMIRQVFIISWC